MINVDVSLVTAEVPAMWFRFGDNGLVCVALVAVIVFLATSTRRIAHKCPRCGEVNRDVAIYCAQCGTKLKKR